MNTTLDTIAFLCFMFLAIVPITDWDELKPRATRWKEPHPWVSIAMILSGLVFYFRIIFV